MAPNILVTLAGEELKHVKAAAATIDRPAAPDGKPSDLCSAATFVVTREVDIEADTVLFELFSNKNGTRKLFDGQIQFRDDRDRVLSTYKFQRGFVSSYHLTTSGGSGMTEEVATIHSGLVNKSSKSDQASLKHGPYIEKTD